jgi:hypothetical protein
VGGFFGDGIQRMPYFWQQSQKFSTHSWKNLWKSGKVLP